MNAPLLVTGVGRSGTTLVARLLQAHPDLCVGLQPFPNLYIDAKTSFLRARGIERANPLGPEFPGADGSLCELAAFLETDHWNDERLDSLFAAMRTYRGQYFDDLLQCRSEITPGPFHAVYRQLLEAMARRLGCETALWLGSKETWFEEIAPIIVDRGGAAVIVIRDPRAVVASMTFGRGPLIAGLPRPTLFVLRQWRKSVHVAIHLSTRDRCAIVRYEDVVCGSGAALNRLADSLDVSQFGEHFESVLSVAYGSAGPTNSSFDGVDPHRWRRLLDESTVRYVEAICRPEMIAAGYESATADRDADRAVIRGFRDPEEVRHPRFEAGYSSAPAAVEFELARIEALETTDANRDLSDMFNFPDVGRELQRSTTSLFPTG